MKKMVMKAAIIMHKMIVELHCDGYESELFEEAKKAAGRGMFIDGQGEEKKFR